MSRKVFLSFLGAGSYAPITYHWEQAEPRTVCLERYIQKALLEKLKEDLSEADAAYIFLTPEAREMHWEKDGLRDKGGNVIPNKGLAAELNLSFLPVLPEGIDVTEKSPEAMSWEIFEKSFQRIKEEDELHLDITHAFRFMPMVLMALVNYLKAMRRIQVGGIYYGGYDLRKDWTINGEKIQCAPIINLASVSTIQDWATAAHLFNLSGNATVFSSLRDKGDELTGQIQKLSDDIFALRAPTLIAGKEATHIVEMVEGVQLPVPYRPITEELLQDIKSMKPNDVYNMLHAVEWCVERRLVPQGYALLSEFLPTYTLWRIGEDFRKKLNRDTISGIAQIEGKKIKFRFIPDFDKRRQQAKVINKFLLIPGWKELSKRWISVNLGFRNDILHAGFNDNPKSATELIEQLKDAYSKVREVVTAIDDALKLKPELLKEIHDYREPVKFPILLNHSNHPFSSWNEAQRDAAREWGEVEDLPFPNVPPFATTKEVEDLANEYFQKIISKTNEYDVAVHIMGELVFTSCLVQKLKSAGIPCIASTTERIIKLEENGNKTSTFRFVRFRPY